MTRASLLFLICMGDSAGRGYLLHVMSRPALYSSTYAVTWLFIMFSGKKKPISHSVQNHMCAYTKIIKNFPIFVLSSTPMSEINNS